MSGPKRSQRPAWCSTESALIPNRMAPRAANAAARSGKWRLSAVQPQVIVRGQKNSTTGPLREEVAPPDPPAVLVDRLGAWSPRCSMSGATERRWTPFLCPGPQGGPWAPVVAVAVPASSRAARIRRPPAPRSVRPAGRAPRRPARARQARRRRPARRTALPEPAGGPRSPRLSGEISTTEPRRSVGGARRARPRSSSACTWRLTGDTSSQRRPASYPTRQASSSRRARSR